MTFHGIPGLRLPGMNPTLDALDDVKRGLERIERRIAPDLVWSTPKQDRHAAEAAVLRRALRREIVGPISDRCRFGGQEYWTACEKFVKFSLGKIPRVIKRSGRAWAIHEENVKRGIGVVRMKSCEPVSFSGPNATIIETSNLEIVVDGEPHRAPNATVTVHSGTAVVRYSAVSGWHAECDATIVIEDEE